MGNSEKTVGVDNALLFCNFSTIFPKYANFPQG